MSNITSPENRLANLETKTEYGIVFCITGKEFTVARRLERNIHGLRALSPVKLRYRRMGGIAQEEKVILFPGYVFFSSTNDVDVRDIHQDQDVLRLLYVDTDEKDWHLTGQDRAVAEEFFRIDGVIGFSKVFFDEGDRIHIMDGFLKDYEGQIIRVNKRAKTAEIAVEIAGNRIKIWLGVEIIKSNN